MNFIFLFTGLISLMGMTQADLLKEVRAKIGESFESEAVWKELHEKFEKVDVQDNPLLQGYKGALEAAHSRHTGNVFKKLSYFNAGTEQLDKAITQDKDNIELRFLRLTMQVNVPRFLGYHEELESDKSFLLKNIDAVEDKAFREKVRSFIKEAEAEGKL